MFRIDLGTKNYLPVHSVQQFDLEKNRWMILPDMKKSRIGHTVFRNADFLYAFGGKQSSVERLNLSDNASIWQILEVNLDPMILKKDLGFASVQKKKIYP